ncbi:Erythronate-4-phosphate dehydrogenase family protein isoform 3 [Hibiscus syriacus]|uniref:Erythronate-4-phosphate dehydrogenase family protein isoform 3 n=1 Tax=Hibiscus syriacus TaxID=106335 RepID=A0A6A3BRL3_HIBSY|nr:Erythronate-4-phosphate dehydrogenase family protein isoform 3 [Hibiscus syriacus]
MEGPCDIQVNGDVADRHLQIIRYSAFQPGFGLSSLLFDLRVFYVRVSNFRVDDSTPEYLTLNHTPLDPDTLLEVNGTRNNIYSDGVSLLLRRDRVDKKSEEATFVSTDSVRLTGNVKFDVVDKKDIIVRGVLEMSGSNGFIGESKNDLKRWSMNCESKITSGCCFLEEKHGSSPELSSPTIEVYVTGCFSEKPIILTKTLHLNHKKKHNRKGMLDAIPEYESTDCLKDMPPLPGPDMQASMKALPSEIRWTFSFMLVYLAANYASCLETCVRVGVGIGLGVCLGVGIGVCLLVRTYQTATRNLKRLLLSVRSSTLLLLSAPLRSKGFPLKMLPA